MKKLLISLLVLIFSGCMSHQKMERTKYTKASFGVKKSNEEVFIVTIYQLDEYCYSVLYTQKGYSSKENLPFYLKNKKEFKLFTISWVYCALANGTYEVKNSFVGKNCKSIIIEAKKQYRNEIFNHIKFIPKKAPLKKSFFYFIVVD